MGWLYRRLVRPILFAQDPELVHNRTLAALGIISHRAWMCRSLQAICGTSADDLVSEQFGLTFPNPIGLAAGMDKMAEAVPAWEAMGFGHVELGGVTRSGQPGNPQPRVFRAVAEEAIVNRMGFNNPGAESIAEALAAWQTRGRWPRHPVGINLGKSKVTPLEKATEDYQASFETLRDLADFFVVNVSSPNTPNLRQLQDRSALDEILAALQETNARGTVRPILVKVAPDLTNEALDQIVELLELRGVAGLVATNTTVDRPASQDALVQRVYAEAGGLSGKPLRARSTEVIRHLARQTKGRLPIIGVGGIFNPDDAWEKVRAGAALLQIYTGFVYEGPFLVKKLLNGLLRRMRAEGISRWQDVVGSDA